MKITISVPDDVHAEAEGLTRRLKKSRSQLYTDAVQGYLARHDPDAVTSALNRVADRTGAGIDPAVAAVGRRLLQRVEWE